MQDGWYFWIILIPLYFLSHLGGLPLCNITAVWHVKCLMVACLHCKCTSVFSFNNNFAFLVLECLTWGEKETFSLKAFKRALLYVLVIFEVNGIWRLLFFQWWHLSDNEVWEEKVEFSRSNSLEHFGFSQGNEKILIKVTSLFYTTSFDSSSNFSCYFKKRFVFFNCQSMYCTCIYLSADSIYGQSNMLRLLMIAWISLNPCHSALNFNHSVIKV